MNRKYQLRTLHKYPLLQFRIRPMRRSTVVYGEEPGNVCGDGLVLVALLFMVPSSWVKREVS